MALEVIYHMREKSRLDILLSPLFLLGMLTLLLNDFVLKYEYSNQLTGKLSDFSGLFIFPFFLSALFPRYRKFSYLLTVVIFSFWNSSLSQDFIVFLNSAGIQVGRTIDYSDFIAFVILPFSYLHFRNKISTPKLKSMNLMKVAISSFAIFSFVATTLPRQETRLDIKSELTFEIGISKREFFNRVQAGYGKSDSIELNLIDSLFYLHYYIPDIKSDMFVIANITEIESETVIRVDTFLTGTVTGSFFSGMDEEDIIALKEVEKTKHESYFEKYFIYELITNQPDEPRKLYYNNKRVYDEIMNEY